MIKYASPPKSVKDEKPKTVKRPPAKKDVERVTRDMKPGAYKTRG